MTTSTTTRAQDPVPAAAADDPVIAQRKREKEIAQLEKEIAEAKKAKAAAELPATTTRGATGSLSVDDKAGYYAELMAYQTLSAAAAEIATKVTPTAGGVAEIVVTDEMDLALKAQAWHLILGRLDDFERRFGELETASAGIEQPEQLLQKPEAFGATVAALPALLGGIADIAAFFKVDVEVKGRTVTLAKNALIAEVAAALRAGGWTVHLPGLQMRRAGTLVRRLDDLAGERAKAVERQRKLAKMFEGPAAELAKVTKELDAMRAEVAKLGKAKPQNPAAIAKLEGEIEAKESVKARLSNLVGKWKELVADYEALLGVWDAYQKALTEGAAGKPSPVESLAAVDMLQSHSGADRLHLEVASSGGEVHLTKSVWTSGRLSYLGGSVCTFFWVGGDGAFKGSGTTRLWKGRAFRAKELRAGLGGTP